jgi:phospholipase/lecithinase/hemolysin
MFGDGSVCADPSKYYLWDGVHPTAGVHQALGQAFAQAVPVPEPAAWALSLVGVVITGALAQRRRAAVAAVAA